MFLSCLRAEICEKVYFTSITAAILDFFKILLLHMSEKMEPYFFLSRSYSEPESVAKSILTNKKSEITNGPALMAWSGSVAEWLACWTQAQKGPGPNCSRDAVG